MHRAVIPNATVTIANKADSGAPTVTTNTAGAHTASALLAGGNISQCVLDCKVKSRF